MIKRNFLKVSIISSFLFLLSLVKAPNTLAVACTEPSATGNYNVQASCSFGRATIDGVDNGNITVNAAVTLTITSGQSVVWNSGKSITLASGASIQNSGGSLVQGTLWAVDQDADGYGKSTTDSTTDYPRFYTTQPANGVRVNTLTARGSTDGDCVDTNNLQQSCYSYAYSQGTYYRYAYAQSTYYRYAYGQSTYYRYAYGQSSYYRYAYSQGSYSQVY